MGEEGTHSHHASRSPARRPVAVLIRSSRKIIAATRGLYARVPAAESASWRWRSDLEAASMVAWDRINVWETRRSGRVGSYVGVKVRATPRSMGIPPRWAGEIPLVVMEWKWMNCGREDMGSGGMCIVVLVGSWALVHWRGEVNFRHGICVVGTIMSALLLRSPYSILQLHSSVEAN